ncbi:5288_t:CDS:2 [Paraglomus brasilianum]|uniref:5288_t:CDS:1 n=1 Tax=Paraglomus brasilianum TaxID=144538 RepID=A0A9N9GSL0_9GLOM|nr:5288_t:CDS:2 [Paraglomus brasilianum]
MTDTLTRRLIKELMEFRKDPAPDLKDLTPEKEDDILVWKAILEGERDTPYEGGQWKLRINIPRNYPMAPPNIKFMTKICHPNIHFKSGEICLDVLKNAWSPAWTLQSACIAIRLLLSNPEPSSPLNCDADAETRWATNLL